MINIDDGWHNKLNQNVNAGGLNLYLLIKRLHEEATCVVIVHMSTFGARTDHALPENHVSQLHKKIMGLWEKFDNRDLNVQQLLNKCSYLNNP